MQPRKLSRLEYESVFPSSTNSTLDVDKTCRISTPYGIGLAATSALTAGSLIIKLHLPNLLLVEKSSLQTICSFCILESSSLKRCSGCKILYYCSTKCQNRHWKEIHRLECKILKVLPDIPPTAVRALIVMLSREPIESQGTEEKTWKELESHVSELKGERKRWEEIFLQARAGVEFTKAGGARMEDAIRWLCVLSTNAFRITLPDNTPVGLCFSPTLARANHSCDPNAFIVFDSNTVSLRALRPIKLEEQIFISYVDPTEDIILRQSRLKERYFFTCKCPRCVSEENVYEHFIRCEREDESRGRDGRGMEVLNPRQELLKTAERCQIYIRQNTSLLAATNSSKTASLLKQSRDNTQKSPQTRIGYLLSALKCHSSLTDNTIFAFPPYPEIVHETYLAYIDMQAFTPALITILFLFFNCDMFTYPQPHHPVRVIRLYTIAKLLKHLASLNPTEILQGISSISPGTNISSFSNLSMMEDIAKAMQGLDFINSFHVMVILAWSEAKKSHGEESRFVKEIEAEIGDVEEVQRLRGPTGENLRKWMGDEASVDGGMEAERVGAGLRKLAGLMGGFWDEQNSDSMCYVSDYNAEDRLYSINMREGLVLGTGPSSI